MIYLTPFSVPKHFDIYIPVSNGYYSFEQPRIINLKIKVLDNELFVSSSR